MTIGEPPTSYACGCGGREELRDWSGEWFPCGWCNGLMRPWVPQFTPPPGSGRYMTPRERKAMEAAGG